MKSRLLNLFLVFILVLNTSPLAALANENSETLNVKEMNDVNINEITEISTAEELKEIQGEGHYQLTADLALDSEWTPLNFSGTLDGNGYTITLDGKPVFQDLSAGSTVFNLLLDGQVKAGFEAASLGALAYTGSGTIRNNYSNVTINYSGFDTAGGFIGEVKRGDISNCLVSGEIKAPSFIDFGAIAGFDIGWGSNSSNAIITNSYWTSDVDIAAPATEIINSRKVSVEDAKSAQLAALLNSDLKEGELSWGLKNDVLVPGGEGAPIDVVVDKEQLNSKIAESERLEEKEYINDTWASFSEVLLKAKGIAADEQATQSQVDGALEDLGKAIEMLVKDLSEQVDRHHLMNTLSAADKVNDFYTVNTWSVFEEALKDAKEIDNDRSASQETINKVTNDLEEAINKLETRNVQPGNLDGKEVISVSSVKELKDHLQNDHTNKYFQLENDLEIKDGDLWFVTKFNGVLDGNGHVITLPGAALFHEIGFTGIVQNLGVRGKVSSSVNGVLANKSSGLVINSWSSTTIQGDSNTRITGGLVGELASGGAIVNSYAASSVSVQGVVGGLVGEAHENSLLQTSYWLETMAPKAIGIGEGKLRDVARKTEKDFRDPTFISLLNDHRNGAMEWNLSSEGFPYHGEAEEFVPEESIEITFTSHTGDVRKFESEDGLKVSLLEIGSEDTVGTLSYSGGVNWSIDHPDSGGDKPIMVGLETGKLFVFGEGNAEVVVSDASWNVLGKFHVVAEMDEVKGLRLTIDDEVIDKELVVQGSEEVMLSPQVQVSDGIWKDLPPGLFNYSHTGKIRGANSRFYATEPGESTVSAEGYGQSVTVDVRSEYVPVESVKPAPSGKYFIHGRNANSESSGDFLDLNLSDKTGNVIVQPAHASYGDNWTLTSSDPSIAEYVPSFLRAVLPKKAGKVTLTATSNDPKLDEKISGSSEIELAYLNPVTKLTMEKKDLKIKVGEKVDLPLKFIGTQSAIDDGYKYVTEPEMAWTFSGDGKIEIAREALGKNVFTPGSKEYTVANDEYYVVGISAGAVEVTGTPVDQTGGAKPITFTIDVEQGETQVPVDIDALVTEGIKGAQSYLYEGAQNYEHGEEWDVFTQIRSGLLVELHEVESYLQSVKEVYESNPNASAMKPTTLSRVVLALGALGQDATDFEGLDFIEMLVTSQRIADGGNEMMWALIALDSLNYTAPDHAIWNRDKLIDELLANYQNKQTGGFGLTDNKTSSVDLTAMAIQSLAPYYDKKQKVQQSVDLALTYLKDKQTNMCGFNGDLEGAAQVLVALTALGKDPLDEKNGFTGILDCNLITNIMTFVDKDTGGFKHTAGAKDPQRMSSIQALYSLNAYERFQKGENRLYDLTDIKGADLSSRAVLESRLEAASKLQESKYTKKSWSTLKDAKAQAEEVLANATATSETLQKADNHLEMAMKGLVLIDTTPPPVENGQTVTVSVEKHAIGEGYFVRPGAVKLHEGDTAFTALEKVVHDVQYVGSGSSLYVQSINGLGEFDKGPGSGWMYSVNGKFPDQSAGSYTLTDGDVLRWQYTTNLGADIGDGNVPGGDENGDGDGEGKPEQENEGIEVNPKESFTLDEKYQKDPATEITLDFGDKTTELPKVIAPRGESVLEIPRGTKVTSKWDGKLLVPTVQRTNRSELTKINKVLAENGKEITAVDYRIKVGGDETITFDRYVTLTFKGKAGLATGLIHTDGEFEVIGQDKTADVYAYSDGEDLIVKTKHFTEFLLFKEINKVPEFSDVEGHWSKEYVEEAVRLGIFQGYEDGEFKVDNHLTRVQAASVLVRALNLKTDKTTPFKDINSYAKDTQAEIAAAYHNGLIKGYEDDTFRPGEKVTRSQMALMFYRAYEQKNGKKYVPLKQAPFTDIATYDAEAQNAIAMLHELEIAEGSKGAYMPGNSTTRAHAAKMIVNFLKEIK